MIRLQSQNLVFILMILTATWMVLGQSTSAQEDKAIQLRVLSWNIWHGGREDGEEIGPERVIEVIKSSQADLIAMQETYGSGEKISKGLGFQYQARGTNVSIHSRFPILEDISVFEEFKCTGALIQRPDGQLIAFYSVWLPYADDIWLPNSREDRSNKELLQACQPSADDLQKIMDAIERRLDDPKYQDVSIVIAGDFNSMSHRDYDNSAIDQFGVSLDWSTSRIMSDAFYRDAYRETNPKIDREVDSTWSPRFPEQEQDRIDFIYYKSNDLRAVTSRNIATHEVKFPSDHAAVLAEFALHSPKESSATKVNAVSYNIRRGHGSDNKTDLARTAKVIEGLNADFVGLQEVDFIAERSGQVNQIAELGKELNMHPAFGSFMDFQGGRYGLGILSRYPILNVKEVKLPTGNEPRVALSAEVLLPSDERIQVINLHFDWVRDDGFRFKQAEAIKRHLETLEIPFILMGDFNDQPGSRTIELFMKDYLEADKPDSDRFTYSASEPKIEIDFIFASPREKWNAERVQVIDEPLASDHRPVQAVFELKTKD